MQGEQEKTHLLRTKEQVEKVSNDGTLDFTVVRCPMRPKQEKEKRTCV